jgi:hypothetical protein
MAHNFKWKQLLLAAFGVLHALMVFSCGSKSDESKDESKDAGEDEGKDGGESKCCPIDYYQCDGGRRGGKRPENGECPKTYDVYFSPRVETVDEFGCPIIDLSKSTEVSCFSPPSVHDAGSDAVTDGLVSEGGLGGTSADSGRE